MSLRVSLGAFTSARNAALVSARGDGSAMEASPARALRSVFLAYVAAARRRVADADGSRPSASTSHAVENSATHSAIASFPAAAASLLAAASRLDASNDVTSSSAACSFSGFSVVAAALVVIVVVVLVVVVVFACPSRIAVVVAHVVVGTAFVTSANAIGIDRRRGDRLERAGGCLRAGGVCGDAGEICEALRSVLPPALATLPFCSKEPRSAARTL